MEALKRYQKAKKVTLIGAVINIFLAAAKIIFGFIGQSQALIADGIHSLADLLTDGLVLIASKFGSQAPDLEHPYGHGRIETAATLLLSVILILVGVGIIHDGIRRILLSEVETPKFFLIFIAGFSVVIKEWLYHYTKYVANQIQSKLLYINAWHHRSDAGSSIVVVIGLSAAILGYSDFDFIAAIIVGVMIVKMGWSQGWTSVSELVDTGVEPQQLAQIKRVIRLVAGVKDMHQLRTRSMGGRILIDVHVLVELKLSVSEGHHIAQRVEQCLMEGVKSVTDVTVHIDPEEDQVGQLKGLNLLPRQVLLPKLASHWNGLPGADQIQGIVLHYLADTVLVEVKLPISLLRDKNLIAEQVIASYRLAVADEQAIASITVSFVSS